MPAHGNATQRPHMYVLLRPAYLDESQSNELMSTLPSSLPMLGGERKRFHHSRACLLVTRHDWVRVATRACHYT